MAERKAGLGSRRVVVRPARKNDAQSFSTFFTKAWREAGPGALGFTGATDEAMAVISSVEFLVKRLASPNTKILIAEEGRAVVGFASLRGAAGGNGELTGIVVLESATGMGLGTALLRKACQTAVKLGYRKLEVKTEALNLRAIGFYKKSGFTEVRKVTVKVGRASVPVQVLEKRLR